MNDRRIRESLCELLSTFDLRAVAFGTAAEYIAQAKPDVPACLILDVELPDINGLDLQSQIAQGNHPPIVFITGHGDIPASVRAIKAGAIDFLTKPFRQEDLLRAIHAAIVQDREGRRKRAPDSSQQHHEEDGGRIACRPWCEWAGRSRYRSPIPGIRRDNRNSVPRAQEQERDGQPATVPRLLTYKVN